MEEIRLKWTEDRIRNEAAKEKELFVKTIEKGTFEKSDA